VIDAMINNTDVRIESAEHVLLPGERAPGCADRMMGKRTEDMMDYVYEPKGQSLEVGLVQFLIDNEIDVQQRFLERNRNSPLLI